MEQHETFFFPPTVNPVRSQQLVKRLARGEIINRKSYNEGTSQLEESELYVSLAGNYEFYKALYLHMGWHLIFNTQGEFFYVSRVPEEDALEEGDPNSNRINYTLFALADNMVKRGFELGVLWSLHGGISNEDLAQMPDRDSEQWTVMTALGFKDDVWAEGIKTLKTRGFVFEDSRGSIIFSNAAKYFIEHLINKFAGEGSALRVATVPTES
ncbi:condensin complex protein MksE [Ferrimonas balearica]|uniref:condensin complex protein MksE n=1 Tax=Ferrimonas balearica TaxID=44012 RepID=UPI001F1C69BF|nr:hypothetical protein [Ferrimonas balearica]MBY6094675.1 hypothetical protein [Ferrimonas balearica]